MGGIKFRYVDWCAAPAVKSTKCNVINTRCDLEPKARYRDISLDSTWSERDSERGRENDKKETDKKDTLEDI